MLVHHKDYETTETVLDAWGPNPWEQPENQLPKPDGELFFDKLSSVYLTGTMHDEHSPSHLLVANTNVCRDVCADKYQSPCNHFCPASVYEMVADEELAGKKRLQGELYKLHPLQDLRSEMPRSIISSGRRLRAAVVLIIKKRDFHRGFGPF